MNHDSKILVVGHGACERGLVNYFKRQKYKNIFSSSQLALNATIQASVYSFIQKERPEFIFLGSVKSGGIQANLDYPADFMYANLESQNNIFYAAQKFGVKKILFYGSSCFYPLDASQPINEDMFMKGDLEESSESYALAKVAGVKMAQAFKKQYGLNTVVMVPATIYGPECDTDLKNAHVLGALIARFADAAEGNKSTVEVWGTGNVRREFIYVDDFVDASLHMMNHYDGEGILNAGMGEDFSIKEIAQMIADIVGFGGEIIFDSSKPEGVKQKLLDSSRINKHGWKSKINIREGIEKTYSWYKNREAVV